MVVGATALFAELHKVGQAGDYDRGLKICSKILQIAPDDLKALHCKIVCLIQLSNFKDALQIFNTEKYASIVSQFIFEKAYVQYRLNLLQEALQTVDSAPELTPALKELRAQILYRLEIYHECFLLYCDIVKNTNDEYEDERQTNMSAVFAYLSDKESPSSQPWSGLSKYEVLYNAACREALNGRMPESIRLLQKAETAAEEYIAEDGGGEEELAEETGIIKVQKGYCLQMQGKEKEATAIYQAVLKNKSSDQALNAIASNNLVVMNKETNVFDSRKRMKVATQDGLEHKLTSRQKRTILYNQALLTVYSNQTEHCKQLCTKLVKTYGMNKEAVLIEASGLYRDGKVPQAVELLEKYPELKLAAAHLLLSQGDRKSGIKILESPDLKLKPGVIGVLVTLYLVENNRDAVTALFKEATTKIKDSEQKRAVEEAWRSKHGGPGSLPSVRALVRKALAMLPANPKEAYSLISDLSPLNKMKDEVDVDSLEASNWMMGAKVVKKSTRQEQQSPGTPKTDKKKRTARKRKTKLPANVDLSVAPDPERWLPRYDRTAFRKRRQRGLRDVIKGSQGMTTSATDQYDMTKQTPSQGKSPRVTPQTQSEPGWQKNKQQKKAKRKGGKW